MIGYMMKNSEGKYLSMDGGETTDWFKASKFDEEGIESRQMYLECGYRLYKFNISEPVEVIVSECGNYCNAIYGLVMTNEGIFKECNNCKEKVPLLFNESNPPLPPKSTLKPTKITEGFKGGLFK